MTGTCQECGTRRVVLRDDPRDPPLDDTPCLCVDCYRTAAEQVIEECEDRISELKVSLRRV